MAFDFPSTPVIGDEYSSGGVTYSFNGTGWVPLGAALTVPDTIGPPQGRLTLANFTPVMTLSVPAALVIYYCGYIGDEVPIFNGNSWSMVALPNGQLSAALNDTVHSPAIIGPSKCNDWFLFLNAGGVLCLGHGPDWANDTTRVATLARVNGLLVNNVAITNGPAQQRGTYVGTTRSNADGTIDWIYGTLAVNGGPGFFGVWNAYNRVDVASMSGDTQSSLGFSAQTFIGHPPNVRHTFVCGLAEDAFEFIYNVLGGAPASGYVSLAIGYDTTSVKSGNSGYVAPSNTVVTNASYRTTALGCHYACALAVSTSAGLGYVYGNSGLPLYIQSGFWFKGRM